MMEGIYRLFDSIWRLSLVGSYCILLVILARFLLKKAPKWCSYLLWGIVFVRLCCPVLPGTRISLIPERLLTVGTATTSAQLAAGNSAGSVDNEGVYNDSLLGDNTVDAVLSGADNTENPNSGTLEATGNRDGSAPALGQDGNVEGMNEIGDDGVGGIQAPGNVTNALDDGYPVDNRDNVDGSLQTFRVLSIAWLLGMAGFMGYHAFSYLRMRHRIRRPDSGVRQVEPGICEIDGGHLSFVMGLIHPVIYLSSGLDPESRKVVLCHERVHLQRRDYLFKPAALVICCVHWFNPLVWLAFYLMNMDCEMSCDEKVVKLLGEESKKIYSYTLLEEASGGEWKRYRGGSICALLSFGEDHVKNRIRHVLDYRKPPFWMLVGAVAVLVILVVCLCSNPGGGTDAVSADNDTETGADATEATDMTGTSDETAEGDLTAGEVDYEAAKTEWLTVFEQGIHSREEFSALFDVAALEDTRSFAGQDGIQYLGYDGVAARKLHQRILDGDAAAHETYKDPVKAAEALLNLQGGSGEMTELLYEAGRQYLFFQKDSTRPGEGSVANVHYIFADGSGIDIPMVFAEESSQIWLLSLGDIDSKGRHSTGPLDGENQARVVYAEYGPRDEDWATVAELSKKWVYVKVSPGSFADVAATYQVSSYGIYAATGDDTGLNCMVSGYIVPGCAAEGRSTVYQNMGNYYTSDSYRQEMAYLKQQDSVRLYYFAASDYQEGDLDIWIDTIREYDTSGQTGENGVTDWKLPSKAQDFSADMLTVEDGYWILSQSSGTAQMKLPLLSSQPVWNGKVAADLTTEEADAYAAAQRRDILTNVGVVFDLSERAEQETYALLDLDGDGTAEKILLRSRMAQAVNEVDHSPLDQYIFAVNTMRGETRTAQNLGNSIYAFTPDGRQILLTLMRRDEFGQCESFLFSYENGELQEVGSFAQDIREIWVENGQIITNQPYDYTLQKEKLRIVYRIGSDGRLAEIPTDRYDLPEQAVLHGLNKDLEVCRTPDAGSERFTINADHGVYFLYLDAGRQWLCVETENGVTGWLKLADYTAEEAWATFNDLIPNGG
ncbi:M56 family metallopeptidase [Simiaoa sp.]|uniref:M56 family metallopeptidase n=1 Tax=Simiaoa sp. TaxID=2944202 RepID=UPI003F81F15C